MLFWRNVEQIGVYLLPVTCVYLAADYGQYRSGRKFLPLLLIVPLVGLGLLFTDGYHHIMRAGYSVDSNSLFGHGITVRPTLVGMMFVLYSYCLALAGLIMLGVYAAKVTGTIRKQAVSILLAILLVFILAMVKTIYLEPHAINLPVIALFLPGGVLMFYNLYKFNLFHVSPIARDKVFDVIEQGIIVTDKSGKIVDRNPYIVHLMKTFFGINDELSGKSMADVFGAFAKWVTLATENVAGELEVEKTLSDAQMHYFRIRVYPLQSDRGGPIGTVSIIRDITARRMQEFALKNKANMDGLTGLLNRNGFIESFEMHLKDAEATGEPVSVLMMDIDKFKTINDTFGHVGGDKVLGLFSDLLRSVLRQKDAVGRLGGDEFAAALPGVGRAEALAIAERIRAKAEEKSIEMDGDITIRFTLSIGVCDSVGTNLLAADMLKCADRAMYEAKRKSRNCCVVWE